MKKAFLMALALILSYDIATAICYSEQSAYESAAKQCESYGDKYGDCREANMKYNLWQGCLMKESIKQQQEMLNRSW